MFLERKITAEIRGGEPFRHFSAIQGWDALQYSVCTFSVFYTSIIVFSIFP